MPHFATPSNLKITSKPATCSAVRSLFSIQGESAIMMAQVKTQLATIRYF